MQRDVKLRNYPITKLQNRQRGYMMITLMLALTIITMGLLVALPDIKQQIRRDREEEMMHRGTAYMRAIQHFYKKLGRYPSRVDELENTNNVRFLRKRYTDPVNRDPKTGKERDFKLLHQQDISLNNGPVLGQTPGQGVTGGPGGLGGTQGQAGLGGLQGGIGGLQPTGGQTPASGSSASGSNGNTDEGAEGNSNSSGSSSSGGSSSGGSSSSSSSGSNSNSGSGLNGQTFGGGPILGVASTSKEKSIRVFFEKNHYNDWLFIYVSQADLGGLLKGPVNPGMPTNTFGAPGAIPGQGAGGLPGQGISPAGAQSPSAPTQPTPSPAPSSPQQ
jgi:type II secretory pathway pseudopilin PulG